MKRISNLFNSIAEMKKFILLYILTVIFFVFITFNQNNYLHPIKNLLIIFIIVIEGIICLLFYKFNSKELHKVAFVIILVFGTTCLLLTPVLNIDDGVEHFFRAEATSRGVLVPEYDNVTHYVSIKSCKHIQHNASHLFTSILYSPINQSDSHVRSMFAQNPFYGYIAPAIGIFLSKVFNLTEIFMVWLGSFFNLLLYASFAYLSIKKAPKLKMPLLVCACIPLALYQGASVSIDSFVFGISLLLIAYFISGYSADVKSTDKKEVSIISILLLLLALIKPNYIIFGFLFLFIPRDKFENKNTYLMLIGTLMLVLVSVVLYTKFYSIDVLNNSYRQEVFNQLHTSPSGQLNYMFSHKTETLILFSTLTYEFPLLMQKLFNVFWYFDYERGYLLSYLYYGFFALVTFLYPIYLEIKNSDRIKILIIALVIIVGTYFIQLLTWAGVGNYGAGVNWGVNFRYFIPLFALMPLIFNINRENKKIENLDVYIIILVMGFIAGLLLMIFAKHY